MTKVKNCTIWTNGMVSSFDDKGEQIPGCQGFILEVAGKLKICCDKYTKWSFGKYEEWLQEAKLEWYWEKKKEK